jgi:hypothetical protein
VTDTIEYVTQGRPKGSRNRRTKELWDRLEARGDLDPADFLSSIVSNPQEPKEQRIQASGLLMPYKYGRHGSIIPARYLEDDIEVPEFTSVEIAEKFLAYITARVAAKTLELDFADSLTKMTVAWIQSQYAKQGIELKAVAQGTVSHEQVIRIEGGLDQLPGTAIIGMESYPVVDNDILSRPPTNGHALPDPSTLNPSTIDGVHTAEPVTPTDSIKTDGTV